MAMWVHWGAWMLSVVGLCISTYAGVLLYQGTPTIDDTFDVMVTTGAVRADYYSYQEPLTPYNRSMKRQEIMVRKSRRGIVCLIIGFVLQAFAAVGQLPLS